MKTIALAAAIVAATVTVSAAGTPAFAQSQVEGSFQGAKVSYKEKTGEYCFKQQLVGSHIRVTECRSKQEWAQAGLTITHQSSATQLARR